MSPWEAAADFLKERPACLRSKGEDKDSGYGEMGVSYSSDLPQGGLLDLLDKGMGTPATL